MSETARTPLKPADIRRRAYALMKQCWKTLLIAAVLMFLFTWIEDVVDAHGERLAMQAYNARMEVFHTENPIPPQEDEDALLEYTLDLSYAQFMAKNEYDETYEPWKLLCLGIQFIDILFSALVAVRLCKGLLNALRVGECTPHILLSSWARASTTCWLAIQITLRVMGWALLPLIVTYSLLSSLGEWGALVGVAIVLLVAGWASLHYALSRLHLADDMSGHHTASECLRLAVDDADAFGLWNMCKVLLPAIAMMLLSIAIDVVGGLVPAVSVPAAILVGLADLLCLSTKYACFACIYDEMRQRALAVQEAAPGRTRAEALESDRP